LPGFAAPLWWDELVSIEAAYGHVLATESLPRDTLIDVAPNDLAPASAAPITKIWTSLEHEANPPLYYVLLRAWMMCFGHGDLSVRALSLVLGLATIVLTYATARQRLGSTPSLFVAVLMAVSVTAIYYAQEVRAYAMLMALTALAMLLAERWAVHGRTAAGRVGLTITLALLPLTHYYGIAPAAAVVLYVVIALRGRDRLWAIVVAGIAAMIFSIAWGPWLLKLQIDPRRHAWLQSSADDAAAQTVLRIAAAPARLLINVPPAFVGWFAWSILLLAAPLLLWRRSPALRLPGLILLAVIALPAFRDLAGGMTQLQHIRYLIAAVPAAAIAVSALLWWIRKPLHRGIGITLLLCVIAIGFHPRFFPHREQWSELIASIRHARSQRPTPLVIISDPERYHGNIAPLMALLRYAPDQARDVVLSEQSSQAQLPQQVIEGNEVVLLFCGGTQPLRPSQLRSWDVVGSTRLTDYTLLHVRRP